MKQKYLFNVFFLLFFTIGWAQEIMVKGTVSSDEMPLPGAAVVVKGTTHGTQTDFEGNYTLTAKEGDILVFSFVGYTTQERRVTGSRPINVSLKEEANVLEEVVLTAYGGTQKKAKVTSSIASVKTEVLSTGSFSNPAQALSGAVAGLRVAQTSGSPGAAPTLVLRGGTNLDGSGSPLVIIDGQIRGGLNDINPDDIESMDILKDAGATAIYGARASNGVVLVTTKKGRLGVSSLNVKLKHGFAYMNNQVEFLNARDYLYWQRTAVRNSARVWQNASGDWKGFTNEASLSGAQPYGTGNIHFKSMTDDTVLNPNESANSYWSTMFSESLSPSQKQKLLSEGWQTMTDPITGKELIFYDFDFKKAAFRPFALTRDYSLSMTGGNDKGKYYAGLGYYNQEGLPIKSWYKRLTGTLNAEYKLKPWLTSTSNFSIAYATWYKNVNTSADDAYFGRMLSAPPTQKEKVNGQIVMGRGGADGNPRFYENIFLRDNNTNKINFGQSLRADLYKGLSLTVSGQVMFDEEYYESFNKDHQTSPGKAANNWSRTRSTSASFGRTIRQTYNSILNYKFDIKSHHFDAMAGYEYYDSYTRGLSASGSEAPTDEFEDLGLTSNKEGKRGIDSYHYGNRIKSYFGRLNYDYADKYLFSFTIRRDGYSRLINNRWGNFPAASLGWIITREEFIPDNIKRVLSFAKLRTSFGLNGNVPDKFIGDYTLQGSYGTNKYNGAVGYVIGTFPNKGLRWEKTRTFEVGLDLGFIQNRINANFTLYDRLTSDKIQSMTLPHSSGASAINTNNGSFRNRGVEIETNFRIIDKNDLHWSLAINAAYNKNTVVKLPHNGYPNNRQDAIEVYNPTTGEKEWVGGYQEGQEPGDMYAHEALGIYQNEEQVKRLADNLVDETGSKKLYGPAAWARLSDAEKEKGLPIQPGDVIWRDVNGDGKIDNYDLVKAGNIYPKWTGGINTTLSYKNIRLSARMDYALNFKQRISIGNSLPWYLGNMQGTFNTVKQVNDTWTPDNPTAKYPKYYWADQLGKRNYYRSSTMFIYEGSYLAFREIALSYNFQKDIVSKMGLDNLELSLIGQNLGYLTKAETYSPEALGQSNSGYPLPRTIILGLNLTF
ncbi:TonB-dependent receptor plug [Capnocytophaga ochracea DSM 7271]|uniref:TonB-dependent receptor plug n=1 Tax=Capnocytophaga ochracea (strain ATCC 27872 / DSM 7271 / CCUG 9716 / JCM 12966 / NCTC 12371 / SS31 / VPI 2845) TaxID=521097 RepID=C7M3I0_CAPOD|nr:TonB-dependent receptor [Capnocytophaga ochracea]ACU93606.1 TonB-dependent receptor plug [Capnocytophaga ochracea DSM 7271]UAK50222.1 TonB-dependent receptor [Capnocytophaga ochracea]